MVTFEGSVCSLEPTLINVLMNVFTSWTTTTLFCTAIVCACVLVFLQNLKHFHNCTC
ncbi:hypothetical protein Smp_187950 [Schistosoma mansoni]|uniref:Small hydrophobic protein n=1 Tax=Schistosoma mansoni TaxID=6183 RepID=C1M1S1_SCHMA|nr:hypothetical protein Smp_187950 [Schistosoma mansoni]|eukprot:XP_018650466.1 hypothetical protein Smp_187950 [Schistosoma mansoni]